MFHFETFRKMLEGHNGRKLPSSVTPTVSKDESLRNFSTGETTLPTVVRATHTLSWRS